MEEKTTVVIDIQLDEQGVAERLAAVNEEMQSIKDSNRQLRKDVKEGNATWKDVSVLLADNEAKMKTLKAEQSALSGQVAQATQRTRSYGTSLKEQAALLSDLKNRYQSLNREQRESAKGQDLLKQIQALDGSVKGADYSMGMFQRNVGNYKSALEGLGGSFNAAGVNVGFFGKAVNALKSGGPIVAAVTVAVTALTAAVKRLSQEYRDNEEAAMGLREAMAETEVVTMGWKALWASVAELFNTSVNIAVRGATTATYGLLSAMQGVVNLFGGNAGFATQFKAVTDGLNNLRESQNRYIKAERAARVQISELEVEISDLRAKAADREKYTAEERLAFLDQAIRKETKIAGMRQALAKENLRLTRAESAMAKNSAEANEKLTQADIQVNNTKKEYNETVRRLNRERNTVIQQLKTEKKETDQVREAVEQIKLDTYDERVKALAEDNRKLANSLQEVADRLGQLKTETEGLADAGKFDGFVKEFTDTVADAPSKMEELAAAFTRNAQTIESTASSLGESFGSLSDIYAKMAEDETKSEEERAEAAQNAQRWAELQIAANAGTAMAKGIVGAMDAGGFPANLAALASVVAALIGAIAQAKALAESHAGGGPVGNRFTGATMGPDDTIIRARRSELVLNANQQRQLWELANGTAPSASLETRLAAALRAMPAPVLEYSEFKRFEGRTVAFTDNQRIK